MIVHTIVYVFRYVNHPKHSNNEQQKLMCAHLMVRHGKMQNIFGIYLTINSQPFSQI
jgi:hypothetical protein